MMLIFCELLIIEQGHPVTVFVIHDWAPQGDESSLPDYDTLLRHVNSLSKHQEHSGDGKICVMDL